jgi:hypothetical protein
MDHSFLGRDVNNGAKNSDSSSNKNGWYEWFPVYHISVVCLAVFQSLAVNRSDRWSRPVATRQHRPLKLCGASTDKKKISRADRVKTVGRAQSDIANPRSG